MITFVILHYLATESTIKCVDCIKALDGSVNIVIVDNASPDGSGSVLKTRYAEDKLVTVLLNSENSGFARGNNLGVAYAGKHFSQDFIVVLNDDVEIRQKDFCSKIHKIYNERAFDILGPDIISQYSGVHQSPKCLRGCDLETVRKKIAYVKRSQNPILMYLSSGEKSSDLIWRAVQRYRRAKSGIDFASSAEGVVLHGSCVVFSRRFLDAHPAPFFPGTFMYYEMEILEWLCRQEGISARYDPSLTVLHHQNIATHMQYNTIVSRSKFVARCLLDSLTAAEKLILQHEAAKQPARIQPFAAESAPPPPVAAALSDALTG